MYPVGERLTSGGLTLPSVTLTLGPTSLSSLPWPQPERWHIQPPGGETGKANSSYSRELVSPSPSHFPSPSEWGQTLLWILFWRTSTLFYTVGLYGPKRDLCCQCPAEVVDAFTACLTCLLQGFGELQIVLGWPEGIVMLFASLVINSKQWLC